MRLLRAAGSVWLLSGITPVTFLVVEGAITVIFFVRDSLRSRSTYVEEWWSSEVFDGSEWIAKYSEEFKRCSEFSETAVSEGEGK